MPSEEFPVLRKDWLEGVYKHASAWKPFDTEKRVIGYLEECLSHLAVGMRPNFGTPALFSYALEEACALTSFYNTVLFRYMEKTRGFPKEVQTLDCFDTKDGNQVDMFIKEFFGVD